MSVTESCRACDNGPLEQGRRAADAYLAVTRCGFTLAPILGRPAAGEILAGLGAQELKDLRPARFT